MLKQPQEFAHDVAFILRTRIARFDEEAFRPVRLLGYPVPECPVLVGDVPDEDIELYDIATLMGYKHNGPVLVWNNFRCVNAYFVWTSPIAQLASRRLRHQFICEREMQRELTISAMLTVRKRVMCNAERFPAFRFYELRDLPIEEQGRLFSDQYLRECVVSRDKEHLDELILHRLLERELARADQFDTFLPGVRYLINQV